MIHKYRAYDEEAEFMVYSDKETDDYSFGFLDGEVKCWALEEMIDPNDPMEPPFMGTRKINNIMQSTGFKAKNGKGKDVYDDDYCLIRVDFSQPDAEKSNCENLKVYIFYDDQLFAWCWHAPGQYGGQTERFDEYEFDIIEVIGNIHQNPGLLDK